VNICQAYEKEVVASELYILNTAAQDELLQVVMAHQLFLTSKGRSNNLQNCCKILGQYSLHQNLLDDVWDEGEIPWTGKVMSQLKAVQASRLVGTLLVKSFYGVFYQQTRGG